MNPAAPSKDLAAPAGAKPVAPTDASPGDPKATPPVVDKPGGMIGEGEAGAASVEGVESETETRADGGMIGEG
ncbi:hypothetical protein [Caulobacter sp. FWC2]|uniref:hypothetical protein n=1 Tax=Caulobacter sp. FWC2 TaxID=69664 RepID=UPI001177CFDC|nr:hypothetical protein [Caulobacter sp. FWC2]